ncbi:MAG TPA: potassium transporter Kup [Novimethylophilus sp.]|jgi:KUP system potassium uptake protein|uniref:potassium transporter Kup n=1 Tax=Novimethylophilus sp. TaxID=2137426 RepID=UPI002F3ECBDD
MHQPTRERTAGLALAALGVVYGDIGTSPLYTIKEVFAGAHHPVPITPDNVLGILSLIFWSLIVVVSVKYVAFIMRADNKGEGGIMALMALVLRGAEGKRYAPWLMLLGLFGAALFYGDGVITPAISVLSAVEGLEIATPALKPYVIPVTLLVLVALFFWQRKGTASVGALFGPVMILWFATLALLGVVNILHAPQVLQALNPLHAAGFMAGNPSLGFFALGAVVLAVTGTEALYADMGHFGRRPVQLAWFGLVLPALVLNYFGQGALLLTDPTGIQNPFYLLAPAWALYPLVALATVATVIASQAVISGAYSLTQQAMQLGYSPRLEVQHTSSEAQGQVYLPGINWVLLISVMALVLGFGSSTSMAAAYGIAVTGTMVITTILAFIVVRNLWGWNWLPGALVLGAFMVVDLAYFSANIVKIHDGGWFPLVFGLGVFLLMTTWKRGRQLLGARLVAEAMPLEPFVQNMAGSAVPRVPGTAVFMTQNLDVVPHALLHSLKHYKALHERIVLLTVVSVDEPTVDDSRRVEVEPIDGQFSRLRVFYGFMDKPDLPQALEYCAAQGLAFDMLDTSFFLGRETLIPKAASEMSLWREKLFVAMFRNAGSAAAYFKLPPNRVVELGAQVVL